MLRNWIILIVAGLCECGFTFCLGKAKVATGWEATAWYSGFVIDDDYPSYMEHI